MSETNAAFAKRTTQFSKNKLDRYMESYGYKYIQNCLDSSQHLISEKPLNTFDTKKCLELRLSVHSVQQATVRN